jgi:hypothetical protein
MMKIVIHSPSNPMNGPPRYQGHFYEQNHCTPSRRGSVFLDRRQSYSPHPYAPFYNPSRTGSSMTSPVSYFNNDQIKGVPKGYDEDPRKCYGHAEKCLWTS